MKKCFVLFISVHIWFDNAMKLNKGTSNDCDERLYIPNENVDRLKKVIKEKTGYFYCLLGMDSMVICCQIISFDS